MEAGAKDQQVDAAEQEADPHQDADHRQQAGWLHRQDHEAQHQGDKPVGQPPAPAGLAGVGEGHDGGHQPFHQEDDADRRGQGRHLGRCRQDPQLELLQDPAADHQEQG